MNVAQLKEWDFALYIVDEIAPMQKFFGSFVCETITQAVENRTSFDHIDRLVNL